MSILTTLVVLVDQTPVGKLTESMREVMKKLVTLIRFKLKVEDRGGTMFRTLLLSNTKREP